MTQFYARENESLRAKIASLESAAAATGSTSSELDETLRKRLQDAERRANDAEAQMTGMERAHLNALTRLETAGREAAAAAEEHENSQTISNGFDPSSSKRLAPRKRPRGRRRTPAGTRRRPRRRRVARSQPRGDVASEIPRERRRSARFRPRPTSSFFSSSSFFFFFSSRLIAAAAFGASVASELRLAPGGQARGRARAQTSRGGGEARSGGSVRRERANRWTKKDAELAELRELVAKLRGDASEGAARAEQGRGQGVGVETGAASLGEGCERRGGAPSATRRGANG